MPVRLSNKLSEWENVIRARKDGMYVLEEQMREIIVECDTEEFDP